MKKDDYIVDVFNKITSRENINKAYIKVRRGKFDMYSMIRFEKNLEENLDKLRQTLLDGTYYMQQMRTFTIYEPKMRVVEAPNVRDRIVHQAIMNVIRELYTKIFCKTTCASIPGRGTHYGVKILRKLIKTTQKEFKTSYVILCDISKYFKNIDHRILLKLLKKRIKDKRLIDLFEHILQYYPNGVGIPIGSFTSQLFANVYLNPMDKFIIHKLHCKYFVRYMDDFVIFVESKEKAKYVLSEIQSFIQTNLSLKLNPKSHFERYRNQLIKFCGYRANRTLVHPLARTIRNFKKRAKELSHVVSKSYTYMRLMSFYGYIKHCTNYSSLIHLVKRVRHVILDTFLKTIRKLEKRTYGIA